MTPVTEARGQFSVTHGCGYYVAPFRCWLTHPFFFFSTGRIRVESKVESRPNHTLKRLGESVTHRHLNSFLRLHTSRRPAESFTLAVAVRMWRGMSRNECLFPDAVASSSCELFLGACHVRVENFSRVSTPQLSPLLPEKPCDHRE